MGRLYVHNGALAATGARMFVPAARSVTAGGHSLPILRLTIGGGGAVTGGICNSTRVDPGEFTLPAAGLPLLVGRACLGVVVTVLAVV